MKHCLGFLLLLTCRCCSESLLKPYNLSFAKDEADTGLVSIWSIVVNPENPAKAKAMVDELGKREIDDSIASRKAGRRDACYDSGEC